MHMKHKELVDQVSANLFKQIRKIESQISCLAIKLLRAMQYWTT